MSLAGVALGIWLAWAGSTVLGSVFIGLFLWLAQQSALWLVAPGSAPSDVTLGMTSSWQRLLLSIICLIGAAVCGLGIYLWSLWPEEWQAGLVFILFGLLVLAPVTIWELQVRRKTLPQIQSPALPETLDSSAES